MLPGRRLDLQLMGPYFDWEGWFAILEAAVWQSWSGGFKAETGRATSCSRWGVPRSANPGEQDFSTRGGHISLKPKSTNL